MKILATDLDRTLLPNGSWPVDENAIELFNEWTAKQGVLVVYVTGRNLDLTENAIREFGVRFPDILCGDVGTTIRHYKKNAWSMDLGWIEHVHRMSPRWDNVAIRGVLEKFSGLREQEVEHQNEFKQSYYVDHQNHESIMTEVEKMIGGKFDEVLVYSFDSNNGNGLLDVLPASATKQTSLEYVAKVYKAGKDVVFCGDSGNDVFPLTAGFLGVMVRNADEQLVKQVAQAKQDNDAIEIYHSKGNFKGLNGYYVSGVLEGAYHYGVLDDLAEIDAFPLK
ncbi:MAG: HAD family hydrolase [Candidatus Thiodiazotropha lotti]|nr:HAD family hydrolase [Candidatus Thiodiazotropha lotti]ODC01540.1 HAD family hydrolase [Candidatus Thiodiazotropha endoloripes]MCG7988191.1 HAD family hydrolase [Candidatus Thiodiazotropha lotti]MCG8003256.1 HAD family hydrolase [Candidatus Thiodiazotropha lotti]MCG8007522.1 HAD family hydrolase [Candidatus Thiodiazotropha lotti]